METGKDILIILLLALAAGAVFYLILVIRDASKVVRKFESTVDEVNTSIAELRPRVLPIIENAEETITRVNNDVEQFEFILSDIASVTENIASVSDKVTNIVSAPVTVTNNILDRYFNLRKARSKAKAEVHVEDALETENYI